MAGATESRHWLAAWVHSKRLRLSKKHSNRLNPERRDEPDAAEIRAGLPPRPSERTERVLLCLS